MDYLGLMDLSRRTIVWKLVTLCPCACDGFHHFL